MSVEVCGERCVSESDSFIDEVSEEVRRDRLYGMYKRYGWIALGAVLLIVGAAAFNEWRKAQTLSTSQAAGDQILSALEVEDPAGRVAALEELSFADAGKQALVKLQEAAMLVEDGRPDEAVAVYQGVAAQSELGLVYTDLAKLKIVLTQPEIEEATALIEELSALDRPFRLLAIEQRALAAIRAGTPDAAIEDLAAIISDNMTTQDLRDRAQQLTVVLGGEVPQTPSLLSPGEDG